MRRHEKAHKEPNRQIGKQTGGFTETGVRGGGDNAHHAPVMHRPQKKCHFADFWHKIYDWKHLYLCIFLYDIPSLCPNFSHTFDPKMHHPAMES